MKIYSIYDEEFKKYGAPLSGYDFGELLDALSGLYAPDEGIVYEASRPELESCIVTDEILKRGFGSYQVQLGYVAGKNDTLDCLEYHKTSEFNIAGDDVILVLGCESQIQDGKFDTSLAKAFLVPKGEGVELYGTTLHYAPINANKAPYRVVCVLPKGTNAPKVDFEPKTTEDKMCYGVNKWLLSHPDAAHKNEGVYVGLTGENICIK